MLSNQRTASRNWAATPSLDFRIGKVFGPDGSGSGDGAHPAGGFNGGPIAASTSANAFRTSSGSHDDALVQSDCDSTESVSAVFADNLVSVLLPMGEPAQRAQTPAARTKGGAIHHH